MDRAEPRVSLAAVTATGQSHQTCRTVWKEAGCHWDVCRITGGNLIAVMCSDYVH
jgi:hypothetical protein